MSFDRSGFASYFKMDTIPPSPSRFYRLCSTYVVLPAARAEKAQGGEQKFLSRAYPFTIKVANSQMFSLQLQNFKVYTMTSWWCHRKKHPGSTHGCFLEKLIGLSLQTIGNNRKRPCAMGATIAIKERTQKAPKALQGCFLLFYRKWSEIQTN